MTATSKTETSGFQCGIVSKEAAVKATPEIKRLMKKLSAVLLSNSEATLTEEVVAASNEGLIECEYGMANELIEGADGYAQIAPYGDALNIHPEGFTVIQRFNLADAQKLVSQFNERKADEEEIFPGVPIYKKHPKRDGVAMANDDRRWLGRFTDLQARDTGLYGKAQVNKLGKKIGLTNRFPTAHWFCQVTGKENDKLVLQPFELEHVGLTNRPNLPVAPMFNEAANEQLALINAMDGHEFYDNQYTHLAAGIRTAPINDDDRKKVAEHFGSTFAARGQFKPDRFQKAATEGDGQHKGASYTRQHYQHVADMIKSAPISPEAKQKLAEHFTKHFEGTNPQYNAARFSKAALGNEQYDDGTLSNEGNSEGAKKGWETRRGAGGEHNLTDPEKWNMFAPGTGAHNQNANSFQKELPGGHLRGDMVQYNVNPLSKRNGFSLDTAGHPNSPGLWANHGVFNTHLQAMKAAHDHYQSTIATPEREKIAKEHLETQGKIELEDQPNKRNDGGFKKVETFTGSISETQNVVGGHNVMHSKDGSMGGFVKQRSDGWTSHERGGNRIGSTLHASKEDAAQEVLDHDNASQTHGHKEGDIIAHQGERKIVRKVEGDTLRVEDSDAVLGRIPASEAVATGKSLKGENDDGRGSDHVIGTVGKTDNGKGVDIGNGLTVTRHGMDANGNHSVWVKSGDGRSRKIQTNGNLPSVHSGGGEITLAGAKEIRAYHGKHIAQSNERDEYITVAIGNQSPAPAGAASNQPKESDDMKAKEQLIALLAAAGYTLGNEAGETEIAVKIEEAKKRLANVGTIEVAMANEKKAGETLTADLALAKATAATLQVTLDNEKKTLGEQIALLTGEKTKLVTDHSVALENERKEVTRLTGELTITAGKLAQADGNLRKVSTDLQVSETILSNERAERNKLTAAATQTQKELLTATTALSNEQKRVKELDDKIAGMAVTLANHKAALVDFAIATGRVLPAARVQFTASLSNDAEVAKIFKVLAAAKPALKVVPLMNEVSRQHNNAQDVGKQYVALVNELMTTLSISREDAWQRAKKDPRGEALLVLMHQPETGIPVATR